MRKKTFISLTIVLVMLATLVAGCDLSMMGGIKNLSTPSWTHGKWEIRVDGETISSLIFSKDNIILNIEATGIGLDFKEFGTSSGVKMSEEVVSNSIYKVTMTDNNQSIEYKFSKTSDTTLDMEANTNGLIQILYDYTKY